MPPIKSGLFKRLLTGHAERQELQFLSLGVLALCLALLIVSFVTFNGSRTVFGQPLGADFAGFYSAGKLLNENPGERLYDFALQDELYHSILPGLGEEEKLPYVHPPFFAL